MVDVITWEIVELGLRRFEGKAVWGIEKPPPLTPDEQVANWLACGCKVATTNCGARMLVRDEWKVGKNGRETGAISDDLRTFGLKQ